MMAEGNQRWALSGGTEQFDCGEEQLGRETGNIVNLVRYHYQDLDW